MLRTTMMVLATAAALSGGLTADAFALATAHSGWDGLGDGVGSLLGLDRAMDCAAALIEAAGSAEAIPAVPAGLSVAAVEYRKMPLVQATEIELLSVG